MYAKPGANSKWRQVKSFERSREVSTETPCGCGNKEGPWKGRGRAKGGTIKQSHPSPRALEDAGGAGVSPVPTALNGDYECV